MLTKIQKSKKRKSENFPPENVELHISNILAKDLPVPAHMISKDRHQKLQYSSNSPKIMFELQKKHLCLEFGRIIWAKLSGYRPWPALTIDGELVGKTNSKESSWVFWFGDHKISNINNSKISKFSQNFSCNSQKFMFVKNFQDALSEALQLCAVRASMQVKENSVQHLHSWVEKQFQELDNFECDPFAPARDEEYPEFVLQFLEKIQSAKLRDSEKTMFSKKAILPPGKLMDKHLSNNCLDDTEKKNRLKTYQKTSDRKVLTKIKKSKKRKFENFSPENIELHISNILAKELPFPAHLISKDRHQKLQNPSLTNSPKTMFELQNKHLCSEFGRIIWAKLSGYRPWPALTIDGELVGKTNSKESSWVFWFGDHKISNINNSKISKFSQNFSCNSQKFMFVKNFQDALSEALQLCAVRASMQLKENSVQHLHSWVEKQFQELDNFECDPFAPARDEEYPEFVLQFLEKIQSAKLRDSEKTMFSKKAIHPPGKLMDKASSKVKSNAVKIQEICLSCDSSEKELIDQHPLFEGGLCEDCKDMVLETAFAFDSDNQHMLRAKIMVNQCRLKAVAFVPPISMCPYTLYAPFYYIERLCGMWEREAFCAICCCGGELCCCCLLQCGRVYCKSCIQHWVSTSAWEKILAQDPWVCFLCNIKVSVDTHGQLKPKSNWNLNIIQLFLCNQQLQKPDLSYLTNNPNSQPHLRVLSLFDGIGTGKVALDQLGIVTNGYFSSEIDSDAMIVTRVNHGNSIIEIGDITRLTENELLKLCPIDLVIGGSPCNELSLVNPARKGFSERTGILFFEFYRVLNIIQKLCKDRHVFWLFENVAAMKSEYKAIISRYLGCQPALWDAKYFSAQKRARYFWGNIPTIYSMPPVLTEENEIQLDSVLSLNCNRKAMVKQLRTVTTCANSLRQGKILPVQMDGKEDTVWITELEMIFGFPPHYTDVNNLSYSRRQRLLGKAWSLPVIKFLLSPLADIFCTE